MKVGLVYDFRNPQQWARSGADLYRATLDHVQMAEHLGFDSVWIGEQHFECDGATPSPLLLAAAIAARTTRIRIGTWALVLPNHHPVRIAEDVAAIDLLSAGRFDLGVTAGFDPWERVFHTPDDRAAALEKAVSTLRDCWDGQSPGPGQARVSPLPVQRPYPPIWLGAQTVPAARRAGRLACHLLLAGGQRTFQAYAEALAAAGRHLNDFNVLVVHPWFVAADSGTRERVLAHVAYLEDQLARRYERAVAEMNWRNLARIVRSMRSTGASWWLVGEPEYVWQGLCQRLSKIPATHVLSWAIPPGMDPRDTIPSLEAFACHVLPRLHNMGAGGMGEG